MLLFDLPQQLMIAGGLIVVSGTVGFVSGCEFKKDSQVKEHLAEVKESARLEKKDGVTGANAVNELRKKDQAIVSAAEILSGAPKQPLIRFVTKTPSCPEVSVAKNTEATPTTKEVVNEPVAEATYNFHAMWMYDLSLQPDDAKLRAGTYEAAREITVDEGFGLTIQNNLQCNKWKNQLDTLITRIEEKQKTFGQKE